MSRHLNNSGGGWTRRNLDQETKYDGMQNKKKKHEDTKPWAWQLRRGKSRALARVNLAIEKNESKTSNYR